jgi:5-methylcytosine-specific restriction endonuclease McrBC regulatory subunit McrC
MMISVTERGHTEITKAEWSTLSSSHAFWRLVESKVVTVTALPGGRARLTGSNLVGRALCGDVTLEFHEKVQGALLSLLKAGSPSFRTVLSGSPLTELGPLVSLLAQAFVDGVRSYVGSGREWVYRSQRRKSSSIGGRLNVSDTIRLRASGFRHLASFDRQTISHATDLNRVLYAGLREIEVIARLLPISEGILSRARAMSLFFEDCRDAQIVFGSSSTLARTAEDLRRSGNYSAHDDILALAGILLAHNSFDPGDVVPGVAPFSWFVNLSDLFEKAVRLRLASVVSTEFRVTLGRSAALSVFPAKSILAADPDIVVADSSATIVGDVKYKTWSGSAEASDLYQLLVHARAFGADQAFLVFPSDSFAEIYLGPAVTGAKTWLFAVDVRNLDAGLSEACNSMSINGLTERGNPAVEHSLGPLSTMAE